jgi:hypothetical protein
MGRRIRGRVRHQGLRLLKRQTPRSRIRNVKRHHCTPDLIKEVQFWADNTDRSVDGSTNSRQTAAVGETMLYLLNEIRRAILDRVHAQQVRAQVRTDNERAGRVEEDFVWVWRVLDQTG